MGLKTNNEVASDFNLWQEYFDVDGTMSEAEFDAMSIEEREAMIEDAYGTDAQQAEQFGN